MSQAASRYGDRRRLIVHEDIAEYIAEETEAAQWVRFGVYCVGCGEYGDPCGCTVSPHRNQSCVSLWLNNFWVGVVNPEFDTRVEAVGGDRWAYAVEETRDLTDLDLIEAVNAALLAAYDPPYKPDSFYNVLEAAKEEQARRRAMAP